MVEYAHDIGERSFQTIDAIKMGKDVLDAMQRETSVDFVQNLMLDTKEAIEQQR